jgi:hypothetical protein
MCKYTRWILMGLALTACVQPTSFKGEPKFPDGVAGCKQACTKEGLEFGGFVFSGEFATSCVCQPAQPSRSAGSATSSPSGAESSPTAGVVVQTQAAAAAAASNNSHEFARRQQQQQQHH